MSEVNTNENCLYDISCPACGSLGPFVMGVQSVALVADDGTEVVGDIEWSDRTWCRCHACAHDGVVRDFRGNIPTARSV